MAIGILKGRPHTYRHDLESFLYVFLWVAICQNSEELPRTSKLQRWSLGSWDELARTKTNDMEKEQFNNITYEFLPDFKDVRD